MADLATITIPVDSSAMVRAVKDAKGLENSIKLLVNAFDAGVIGSTQFNKGLLQLKRQYQDLFGTSQKATSSVREYARGLKESKAATDAANAAEEKLILAKKKAETAFALGMQRAKAEAKALEDLNRVKRDSAAREDQLRQKYDESYRAMSIYKTQIKELNEALSLGALNQSAYNNQVQQLNQSLSNGSILLNNYTAEASTGLNKFGVVAQQTGYQVSDFIVQVQSGTNPLVAFSQQATQLAGLLTLLPPAVQATTVSFLGLSVSLSAIFAGVTILIPLLSMLAMSFLSSGKESDEVTSKIDKQAQAYQTLMDRLDELALKRQMAASGLKTEEEQTLQNLVNDLLKERTTILERINQLEFAGGTARGAAQKQQADAQKELLQGELDKNQTVLDRIKAEQQAEEMLARMAQIRGNAALEEIADRIRNAEELYDRLFKITQLDLGSVFKEASPFAQGLLGKAEELYNKMVALAYIGSNQQGGAGFLANQYSLYGEGSMAARQSTTESGSLYTPFPVPELERATKATQSLDKALKDAERAAEALRKELEAPLVSAVNSISNAFGDFIARGLSDFGGFVDQILNSFKSMISQMIAMAVKNKIMLSLGLGGITPTAAAAGQVAGIGSAGGMLGSFAGAGAAGTGLLGGFGAAMPSMLGGAGNGLFAVGANAAAAGGTAMAAIGAIAAPLLAVAAVFTFFKKKTTELDNGLRITVNNMSAFVETFKTIQTKQFFGLSKKVTTDVSEASSEISDPIVQAVVGIQEQVIKAAASFGIAEDKFSNFVYDFEVSLKGLTEDQKIKKVNEELAKMGDAFASLSGQFTSMNELLSAAQQRYDLTTRLLELQGNAEELLNRQRELELASVHDLNRDLLLLVHSMEDVRAASQRVGQATSDLRSAMDREMSDAKANMDAARGQLERAIQARVKTIQDGFASIFDSLNAQIDAAQEKAKQSREVFDLLNEAFTSRRPISEAGTVASRASAFSYVSGGGRELDRLKDALEILSEPSEQLFGTFVDYARDFGLTSAAIKESRDMAETTMTADEKTVELLERRLEQATKQEELQIAQFETLLSANEEVLTVEKAMAEYLAAQASYAQVQSQHEQLIAQFPMLNESVLSVVEAVDNLRKAMLAQQEARAGAAGSVSSGAGRRRMTLEALPNGGGVLTFAGGGSHTVSGAGGYDLLGSTYGIPGFAMGGSHSGGLRIVGENGPEIEATGPARIYNNRQTANMFRDPDLAGSVTELKNEVSRMRSEQLQIQLEISKNTKRIYDTERKWDVEGLPATRI